MKKILAFAAFLLLLGIVGTVERGASISLMWWTVPALATLYLTTTKSKLYNLFRR